MYSWAFSGLHRIDQLVDGKKSIFLSFNYLLDKRKCQVIHVLQCQEYYRLRFVSQRQQTQSNYWRFFKVKTLRCTFLIGIQNSTAVNSFPLFCTYFLHSPTCSYKADNLKLVEGSLLYATWIVCSTADWQHKKASGFLYLHLNGEKNPFAKLYWLIVLKKLVNTR